MSDLRARADALANDLCVNHGLDAHDAIRDAILQGMVEALEAEPDEGMMTEAYACSGISIKAMWRVMVAARVKQIKEMK